MNKCMYGDGHVDCRLLHRFINGLRATVWSAAAGHPAWPLIGFFQNIFHIRCFRLPASDKKNKRGTKESWWYCYGAGWSGDQVSIVVARVGGDTSSPREQSQSANRRSALHLRSNHWQIACHTLHMAKHWMITGETENSEKCKISQDKYSGPPTKKLKVQITYFPQSQPQPIFQSVESPTKENPNRRIFWTYYLVILSIFVLVIDDLDELGHGLKVHVWSMFSRPMHGPGSQVCLTFCFPLFCKLVHLPFSLELSGDMLYLLSIWPPSPNCALEIYWIRHHLPCKNGKMWVLQQFNFTL